MNPHAHDKSLQTSAAFWRSYFAKFRRPVQEHELSETAPTPLQRVPSGSLPAMAAGRAVPLQAPSVREPEAR